MKTTSTVSQLRANRPILNVTAAALLVTLTASTVPTYAISVGAGGTGLIDFTAGNPAAVDFASTAATGTLGTTTTFTDAAGMDAFVNTLTSATFASQFTTSTTINPSANQRARFNNNAAAGTGTTNFIQTRASSTSMAAFMATLTNSTGLAATGVRVRYNFSATDILATDQIPGVRAYYSLTGLANSWTLIPGLSVTTSQIHVNGGFDALDVTQTLSSNWTSGSNLYVMWGDQNSGGGTDGAWIFDNFQFDVINVPVNPNLVYNLAHTVGAGGPDGALEVSANQYWFTQSGNNPSGYASGDNLFLTQNPTTSATITVAAAETPQSLTVDHTSGTYVITGAGAISAPLTKTGAGSLTLSSAQAFTSVTLNGGTLRTDTVAQTIAGPATVSGSTTVDTASDLTVNVIDGAGQLTKNGAGTLFVNGTAAGTGTGGIVLTAGKLSSTNAAALGAAAQVITTNGNQVEFFNNSAATAETNQTYAGVVDFAANNQTITVQAPNAANPGQMGVVFNHANALVGTGTVTKDGTGALRLSASNAGFSGNWIINGGALQATAATGVSNQLGTGSITVNVGGKIVVQGGTTVGVDYTIPNNIFLNGGTLGVRSNDANAYTGTVDVTANSLVQLSSLTTPATHQRITVSGQLTGTGSLTIDLAPTTVVSTDALILTNPTNNYSGNFIVNAGNAVSSEPVSGTGNGFGTASITLNSTSGAVGASTVGAASVRVRDDGSASGTTIAYGNNITVNGTGDDSVNNGSSAVIDVDRKATGTNTGNTVEFGSLTVNAPQVKVVGVAANDYNVRIANSTTLQQSTTFTTDGADLHLAGAISGSFGVTVTATANGGVVTTSGSNAYTGPTVVNSGRLNVNGSLDAASNVIVNGGTLAGGGSINGSVLVNNGGTVAPGNSPGILNIANSYTMTAGSTLSLEVNSPGGAPVAGTTYDQLNVSAGAVDITGATLSLTLSGTFVENDIFFVLLNDGVDAITGTFNGLADDSIFTVSGTDFRISYDANSGTGLATGGNDISLTVVPEPASMAFLGLGAALLGLSRRRRRA